MAGNRDFDLTIIGGGPGGYVAAIRGAQRGLIWLLSRGLGPGGRIVKEDVMRAIRGKEKPPGPPAKEPLLGRLTP